MASNISLSNFSRYKDTAVYADSDGVTRFALWEPPKEFVSVSNPTLHRVTQDEIGFLDGIAVRYYGIGYERLWWVILQANGLIDPEREIYPGQVLVIPPRTAVQQFLARLGDVQD